MTVLHDLACVCANCNPVFVTIPKSELDNTEFVVEKLIAGNIDPNVNYEMNFFGDNVYFKQIEQN